MKNKSTIQVLFVCMGNICRSPMAEAVFRQMVKDAGLENSFEIASAGTDSWHAGEPPHPGTLAILRQKSIDPGNKQAHQLNRSDMQKYDYIVAMDDENVNTVEMLFKKRVPRLLDFVPGSKAANVPDPYYTGGFETVYSLVEQGCKALLAHIREENHL